MKPWNRGLTRETLISWPAVTLGILWAITANFGDAAYNETGNFVVRAGSIFVLVGTQFALTWLADKWLFSRMSPRWRTIALLGTFIGLGVLRGLGVSAMMFFVGASAEWAVGPRIFAAVFQSVLVAMVAAAYGTFTSNASELRRLEAINQHLVKQTLHVTTVRETEDNILLEKVRAQLRKALSWTDQEMPDQVLNKLETSIDDVVRPLSKALAQPAEQLVQNPSGTAKVDWKVVWKDALDSDNLLLGWTSVLLFGAFSAPSVWIYGPVGILLSAATALLTWVLMWATRRFTRASSTFRQRSTPLVLAIGSLVVFWVFFVSYPENLRYSYLAITLPTFIILGIVPALIAISFRQSADIAARLTKDNQQLSWAIARSNEISRQHRNAVASALHGTVQSALSACAVRLQIALREGTPTLEAVGQAKKEAEQAIELSIDLARRKPKLSDTLAELRLGWNGVTEIRGTLPTDVLERDHIAARLVSDLLVECVLNSVKHAGAQWVEIDASVANDCIELVVQNPGGESPVEGVPGGGTTLLNDSTIKWSRLHSHGITTVRATLPFNPTEG